MLFSEIIGQKAIKRKLIRTVQDKRIPHAQLFRGPEGVGKLALAIAYAQYISCTNKNENDSCGTCPSCVKYNNLAHPDLHFVFPIIKKSSSEVCDDYMAHFRDSFLESPYFSLDQWFIRISGEAKQGMIYANESNEIIRKLSLKTYESEYKVMIIWIPERMNDVCANKLLKILEEPPAKTVFLLISNQPEEIITTILSRTQHINIPQLAQEEIKTALERHPDYQSDIHKINHIARIANGSYLKALNVLKDDDERKHNLERFVSVMRWAWQVGNKQDYTALKSLRTWSDQMAQARIGRERQKAFLQYAQNMLRENYILNVQVRELNYLSREEYDFSKNFYPFIHEKNVEDLMSEFSLAERHIEQNVNARMVFFDLVLKIILLLKR